MVPAVPPHSIKRQGSIPLSSLAVRPSHFREMPSAEVRREVEKEAAWRSAAAIRGEKEKGSGMREEYRTELLWWEGCEYSAERTMPPQTIERMAFWELVKRLSVVREPSDINQCTGINSGWCTRIRKIYAYNYRKEG